MGFLIFVGMVVSVIGGFLIGKHLERSEWHRMRDEGLIKFDDKDRNSLL